MKKNHLFAVLGLAMMSNFAQGQDSMKTLFHTPKINTIGLYIAPEYQFGQIQNEFTHLSGASFMAIFNQRFSVGVTINRTMLMDYSPKEVSPLYLKANYGGLKMEYTFNPNSTFHVSIPLTIGMGMANLDSFAGSGIMIDSFRIGRQNDNMNRFFVVQPGIQVEANLMQYAKAYIGANYRFAVYNGKATYLDASTLQGFGVYAGLKVGLFNYNIRKKNIK